MDDCVAVINVEPNGIRSTNTTAHTGAGNSHGDFAIAVLAGLRGPHPPRDGPAWDFTTAELTANSHVPDGPFPWSPIPDCEKHFSDEPIK